MASIQDLPDEIILKVIEYLNINQLIKFGEVSKRMRAVRNDKSLWKKINLSKNDRWDYYVYHEIDIPTDFVKTVIENGCQYLSLHFMKVGTPGVPISMTSVRNLCLDKTSSLKYLDLKYCDAHFLFFEEILASCHSLQKLSMASIRECKWHIPKMIRRAYTPGSKWITPKIIRSRVSIPESKWITPKMIRSICYQNGRTLQTLNFEACCGLDLDSIQKITKNCVGLKIIDLSSTGLSKESIDFLVTNITPEVKKINLDHLRNLKDEHVKVLVARCNTLSVLNLQFTSITNDSLTHIIGNLQHTLEKLHVCGRDDGALYYITSSKITELKSMPKLRVLNLTLDRQWYIGGQEIENLKKIMPLMRFGEISADERELLPADGIWDVEAKQLKYFKKISNRQLEELPDKIMYHLISFLELKDHVRLSKVSKRMRHTCIKWYMTPPHPSMTSVFLSEGAFT